MVFSRPRIESSPRLKKGESESLTGASKGSMRGKDPLALYTCWLYTENMAG